MTDNKVMAWLKYKELNIRTANSKYTYGVTLGTSDLPYINRLKHILGVRIRTYGLLGERRMLCVSGMVRERKKCYKFQEWLEGGDN